jgi:micrococcal nuclease
MERYLWHYRARIERVIDGDTVLCTLDVGFHTYQQERVRLLGVNTPEVVGAQKAAGLTAKALVVAWVAQFDGPWPFLIRTEKTDSFGRYLAEVWSLATGASLTDYLRAQGYGG